MIAEDNPWCVFGGLKEQSLKNPSRDTFQLSLGPRFPNHQSDWRW